MPLSPRNLLKLKDEFVLTSAIGLALLIQFIFQSAIVRLVSPEEFGHVNSLLAIQGILNIPIAIWQLAQARSLSSYSGTQLQFRNFAFQQLWKIRQVVLFGFLAYLLLGPLVGVYMKGTSGYVWVLVVLGCLLSVIESWGLACFQSRHAFVWLGLVSVGAALVRLISILILLPHMDSTTAVMIAVLGGFLLPIIGVALFFHYATVTFEKQMTFLELSFIPASLSTVFTILWMNIDFIVARNRFDPIMAGQYAAIAVLCKAVFWFANPIATVYLPRFVKALAQGSHESLRMLRRAVFLCLLISALAVIAGWVLTPWLLALFGGRVATAEMVRWFRLAIVAKSPFVCLMPFLAYYVAKDSKRVLVILLMLLVMMFLYAQTFATNVIILLEITFVSGIVMLASALLCLQLTAKSTDITFSWERNQG